MMKISLRILVLLLLLGLTDVAYSQDEKKEKGGEEEEKKEKVISISGLKFRSVGPALTSGRISDFAVHPDQSKVFYVAVSSGGVWKTENGGITFDPIFDSQNSYSIGCVTIDPNNPNVVWVGSGENNNQRSVAYGDGVYKSEDGGSSWKNVGLDSSEHIAQIIVHPENSDVVYVAAIGPLWSEGGQRGVYKTTDGGKTWEAVLTISENTGVTDLVMDPRNPDVLYAAAFQRRRHVFTYHGGGPESGIYKTTDGGVTWNKAEKGLPGGDKGRIGLAISPANPDYLYAIVEAQNESSGFFRTLNGGASWHKRSGYVTSGNYYQEIIADPIDPNKVFSMNTYFQVTVDGGKTWKSAAKNTKHVDDHCIWIDPTDTDHWLVGCDGGIYETFDGSDNYRYFGNLPVTQFYKVSVDNDEPFYNIYGGTQDNYTLGGPSRTISANGINNQDWFITKGGDGFETAIDPWNPDIVYSQSQYGFLVRFDRKSGEKLGIKPFERKGEDAYRWNWDAPLATSPHAKGRLYFAANKLFRSNDYGNSWDVISEDLTRQVDRNKLEVMGQTWSIDAVAKHRSTSPFGTIVAFSESPVNENVLYVGTDDGLIQITTDGGDTWTEIDNIEGVPNMTYVNALWASRYDENIVYAAFNHHKYGDFKPYVFKSTDKGSTWTNISGDLPERGSVYAFAEDHVDPSLLFVGTEFGIFFTSEGGNKWRQLKKGVPTIAVRDISIQERENDLVLGTFGRGFYVLDDYSSLRQLETAKKDSTGFIAPIRDAWMYVQSAPLGGSGKSYQGDAFYIADNLGPVVLIDYYNGTGYESLKSKRKKAEKEAKKANKNIVVPTLEEYEAELDEESPYLLFTFENSNGEVVRQIKKPVSKGLQRLEWDMKYLSAAPINSERSTPRSGMLVKPGMYTVQLARVENGSKTQIGEEVSFNLKALNNRTFPAEDVQEKEQFQKDIANLYREVRGASSMLSTANSELKTMKNALVYSNVEPSLYAEKIKSLESQIQSIQKALNGDSRASKLDIETPISVNSRLGRVRYEQYNSTSAPTQTHRDAFEIANEEFQPILKQIQILTTKELPAMQAKLEEWKIPYTPGRTITN